MRLDITNENGNEIFFPLNIHAATVIMKRYEYRNTATLTDYHTTWKWKNNRFNEVDDGNNDNKWCLGDAFKKRSET